jgi:hypothetical protein
VVHEEGEEEQQGAQDSEARTSEEPGAQDSEARTSEEPVSGISEEEITRLVRHENLFRDLLTEWQTLKKGSTQDAFQTFAMRLDAAVKMTSDEPPRSPEFLNHSTRHRLMTDEECRGLINGAMLVLIDRSPGARIRILTKQIFSAAARLGTLTLALSDDDSQLVITAMKEA